MNCNISINSHYKPYTYPEDSLTNTIYIYMYDRTTIHSFKTQYSIHGSPQASFPLSMKYNTADTPPNEITEINTDSL